MWEGLKPIVMPAPVETERPAAGSLEGRYVRSFLFLRLMIGFLGFALPFPLVFLDKGLFDGGPFSRGPMSVYYYSNVREVFTVTLGTIAFFLFAYKITERNLDNTLSVVAGFAGMAIPLFPTSRPHDVASFPSFASLFGEQWSTRIHYGASAVFITALGCVCILFGR